MRDEEDGHDGDTGSRYAAICEGAWRKVEDDVPVAYADGEMARDRRSGYSGECPSRAHGLSCAVSFMLR